MNTKKFKSDFFLNFCKINYKSPILTVIIDDIITDNNIDLDITDINGNTFLHILCDNIMSINNPFHTIRKSICVCDPDLNPNSFKYLTSKNNDGDTFLHILCDRIYYCEYHSNYEYLLIILRYIIDEFVKFDITNLTITNNDGNTFLHTLCENYNVDVKKIIKYVITSDIIDLNITNIYGKNFLHILCERYYYEYNLSDIFNTIIDNDINVVIDDDMISYLSSNYYNKELLKNLKLKRDSVFSKCKSAAKIHI